MKKIYSLLKACMTSGMSLFKIKTKKNNKYSVLIPLFIALYLMFMIWGSANTIFEKFTPLNLQHIILSLSIFGISITTFMEGIYKSGSLIFNCKDDQLLLSLPIKKRTILFIRIFKFYIFELLFNSMFLLPVMVAYIRWGLNVTWTYYLTCIIMLLLLPIIPIVLSCIIGVITVNLSSEFKYKNFIQIIISMVFLMGILYISFNMNGVYNYLLKNATSLNDLIIKIYYPAGIFAKLITNFNVMDLIIFIFINIGILVLSIFILSKFYFKINSKLKIINNSKNNKSKSLIIKSRVKTVSLIKKELNTFIKTPVFIINAGFALVLFIVAVLVIVVKFDSVIELLANNSNEMGITKELITNNLSLFIFLLISLTSFMTSITNSVISLEGKNINILKSLPVKSKTILLSKILAALTITTPILVIGTIILLIKFKINIFESILLIGLAIIIPLVSHLIGIIINLKYPKFNWESSAEVVKQSTSSFIAVMLGMLLFIITGGIILNLVDSINSTLLLIILTIVYVVIDIILYIYLIKNGAKRFDKFSV